MDSNDGKDKGIHELRVRGLLKSKGLYSALDYNNSLRDPLSESTLRAVLRNMEPNNELWVGMLLSHPQSTGKRQKNQDKQHVVKKAISEAINVLWFGVEKRNGKKTQKWFEKFIEEEPRETANVFLEGTWSIDLHGTRGEDNAEGIVKLAPKLWETCLANIDTLPLNDTGKVAKAATYLAMLLTLADPDELRTPVEVPDTLEKMSILIESDRIIYTIMKREILSKRTLGSYVKKIKLQQLAQSNAPQAEPSASRRRPIM